MDFPVQRSIASGSTEIVTNSSALLRALWMDIIFHVLIFSHDFSPCTVHSCEIRWWWDITGQESQSWRICSGTKPSHGGRGHTWESWVADTAVLCCFVFQSLALPKHSMPPDRRHVACETMRHADGGFSVIASYSFSSSGRDLFFRSLAPDGSSMLAFGLSGFMFTHPAISTINQLGCGASHSTLV